MRIAIWLKLSTACIDFVLSICTLLNWSKFISRLSLNPNQVIWTEGIYSNSNHQILSKWYDFFNLLIPSSDIKENLESAPFLSSNFHFCAAKGQINLWKVIYDFERCPTQKPHTWTTFLRKWRGFWYDNFAKISRLWIVTADMTSKKVSFRYDELNKRKRKRTVWKGYEPEIMEWYKLELLARGTMKNCIVLLKKRFSAHNNSGFFCYLYCVKAQSC